MVFRDQKLTCQECGETFFFTVTDQRRMADRQGNLDFETPHLCRKCQTKSGASSSQEEPVATAQPHREPVAAVPEPPFQPHREQAAVVPEPPPQSHREQATTVRESPPRPVRETFSDEDFPLEEGGVQVKLIGTVKWFSREKGYGFITKADNQDLFFHRADISRDEHVWPQEGEQVEFQIRRTDKGPEAFNVSLLPTD
jgi:CspA family cold shock protein